MANDQGQDRHLCHCVNFPEGLPKDASPVHLEPNRLPYCYCLKSDFNPTRLRPCRKSTFATRHLLIFFVPNTHPNFLLFLQLNYVVRCENISKENQTSSKKFTTRRPNDHRNHEKKTY